MAIQQIWSKNYRNPRNFKTDFKACIVIYKRKFVQKCFITVNYCETVSDGVIFMHQINFSKKKWWAFPVNGFKFLKFSFWLRRRFHRNQGGRQLNFSRVLKRPHIWLIRYNIEFYIEFFLFDVIYNAEASTPQFHASVTSTCHFYTNPSLRQVTLTQICHVWNPWSVKVKNLFQSDLSRWRICFKVTCRSDEFVLKWRVCGS